MYKVEAFQPDVKAWLGYAEVSSLRGTCMHRNIHVYTVSYMYMFSSLIKNMYMSLQGKLFYYPLGCGEDTVSVISTESLQVEKTLELDGQCPSLPLDNLFLVKLFFDSLSFK